jgi:hypothetical protein
MSARHPHEEALEYLQHHNLIKLFEILGAKIAYQKPADANAFLVSEIKLIKALKNEGRKYALFDETDIEAIFSSFDLTRRGYITKAQYEKGVCLYSIFALTRLLNYGLHLTNYFLGYFFC